MAELNPDVPQAVDPEVLVDLTRLLQIRGPLGVLNVLDTIVPVVSLGNVVTPDINIRGPIFRSTDVFSAGEQAAPPINTILVDTLALPAGIYDLMILVQIRTTAGATIALQHRDAANAANLMSIDFPTGPDMVAFGLNRFVFAYELAINERLRMLNTTAGPAGSFYSCIIFARRR